MRVHTIEKIGELKKLRKVGYSINELVAVLGVPKTTVWHHVHDIRLSPKYEFILKSKRGGSARRTQKNWKVARETAEKLLNGRKRELAVVIAMLYWGEGSKKVCEFINSDGRIIKLYLDILRNVFELPEKTIRPTLRIFSGMDKNACLGYWSKITKIPKRKFLVRWNDGGTRGRTKYGMCRISVIKGSGAGTLKLIHSLIDQVFVEMINRLSHAPVAQLD